MVSFFVKKRKQNGLVWFHETLESTETTSQTYENVLYETYFTYNRANLNLYIEIQVTDKQFPTMVYGVSMN